MNDPDPMLETERLLLRPPVATDFEGFADFMGDEQAAKYVGGLQARPIAWRSFLQIAGSWQILGFTMFSVIEKSSGAWIGRVGPWMPEGWPGTEVGWGILPAYWGRGFATEAAVAAIDWAFETLGWEEVIHVIAPDNLASRRVAAKLGSINRGSGRLPPPFDEVAVDIWGQTRSEWVRRHDTRSR